MLIRTVQNRKPSMLTRSNRRMAALYRVGCANSIALTIAAQRLGLRPEMAPKGCLHRVARPIPSEEAALARNLPRSQAHARAILLSCRSQEFKELEIVV